MEFVKGYNERKGKERAEHVTGGAPELAKGGYGGVGGGGGYGGGGGGYGGGYGGGGR